MMKMALWRNKKDELDSGLVSDVTPFSLYPCLYFLRKEMHRYKGKSRRVAILPKAFGTRCLQQKVPTLQAQV